MTKKKSTSKAVLVKHDPKHKQKILKNSTRKRYRGQQLDLQLPFCNWKPTALG